MNLQAKALERFVLSSIKASHLVSSLEITDVYKGDKYDDTALSKLLLTT
ncbi:MAG: hypothetical protein LBD46_01065 [Endomicrobium sp.]|nr:hypothetical protein [Endomicrobium sp.]